MISIDKTLALPWKGICWHHSLSVDGVKRDWPGIVHYHTSFRIDYNIVSEEDFNRRMRTGDGKVFQTPWKAVGYHGGIERENGQMIFNPGRPLSMVGAHAGVKGASNRFNDEYLGLCAIGNFDPAPPAKEMWDFALGVTKDLMRAFDIPAAHVIGHREVYEKLGVPVEKSCPGKCWSMDTFRDDLK